MNRRLLRFVSVVMLVSAWLLRPTAAETQSQYTTLAGPFSARPSCVPGNQGTAFEDYNCVARAANNVLFSFRFFGGLSSPTSLGMTTLRNPSCSQELIIKTKPGETILAIICAVVGVDNALYGFALTPGGGLQTSFVHLGGPIDGDPSCVLTEDSRDRAGAFATCAVVDANRSLVAIRFNPFSGASSGWQMLGGTVLDNPSCVPANGGLQQVICAVKGTTNSVFGIRFGPQTGYTSGFKGVAGGNFVGSPSCVNTGSGVATCALRDRQNALVAVRFNPNTGAKSPLQNLGGTWVGDPSCAPANQGFNRVVCVGRATGNNLEAIRLDPSNGFSSGFQEIPDTFALDASCAHEDLSFRLGDDSGVFCAARRVDNAIFLFYVNP